MPSERYIENNVIRNREQLGYKDALFIRRCRAGRGFGIADLVILPVRGPHRVVLVEAKRGESPDAASKVIGQLLLYYAGFLQFGEEGLRQLRRFAREHSVRSRSTRPKLLKSLTGGMTPPESAWQALQRGDRLDRRQIALFVAVTGEPQMSLKESLRVLSRLHDLDIAIVSVHKKDQLTVWRPE